MDYEESTGRTAIKFSDGTMIQKRRFSINATGGFSQWGETNLYYLRYPIGTYLKEFIDYPSITIGVECASNIIVGNVVGPTRQSPGSVVLTKANRDSVAVVINYIAIGKYK